MQGPVTMQTNYDLAIHHDAEKEWAKLDGSIKRKFKEKLDGERLKTPRVAKDALRELPDCYKIKITTPQYCLIYHVDDTKRLLTILSVATRDDVYEELRTRLVGRQ
jgi:mRNA interferase RelE/StbE